MSLLPVWLNIEIFYSKSLFIWMLGIHFHPRNKSWNPLHFFYLNVHLLWPRLDQKINKKMFFNYFKFEFKTILRIFETRNVIFRFIHENKKRQMTEVRWTSVKITARFYSSSSTMSEREFVFGLKISHLFFPFISESVYEMLKHLLQLIDSAKTLQT